MPVVFLFAEKEAYARETLLNVFKGQMRLGCDFLRLTIKHKDGYKDYVEGDIQKVFGSQIIKEVEHRDVLLLQHHHNKGTLDILNSFNSDKIPKKVESLSQLLDISKKFNSCSAFILPPSDCCSYFIIKNSPMFEYDILGNTIISTQFVIKKVALVRNNCVGKFDMERNYFTKIDINQR